MKKWTILSTVALFSALLTGCTSAYYASSGYAGDDLYATHDKSAIARRQQQAAEARKAEAEARRAEWEARIAEAEAAAAESKYNSTVAASSGSYTYANVLADTYESAYARRLRGFESPTYRLPSSYYNFRYGDAFHYVSAYDPAFYNIVISGDQVWVEPKYITSMFGTWGATVYGGSWYGSWGWNFGWNYNPFWWNYPSWSWGWGFAARPWYNPWYRPGWGWGGTWAGWRPGAGPGGWGYRPPHNYRLDTYRRESGAATWRNTAPNPAGNRGNANSVNSGRRVNNGSYNRNGSYNNRPANGNAAPSRGGNTNNGNNNNSNSNRSYYNNNSNRSNNSGSYSGSTGGYSGGSRSGGGNSGGGGGSYNRGR